jgi:Fe/S biogenesis protein NfuA
MKSQGGHSIMVTVEDNAIEYIRNYLQKNGRTQQQLLVSIHNGGTRKAKISLAFAQSAGDACPLTRLWSDPQSVFSLWCKQGDEQYVEDMVVGFQESTGEANIVFRAPLLHVKPLPLDATVEQRVRYVIETKVNPALDQHGGVLTLLSVVDDRTAYVRFGGGCQGCGLVGVTLRTQVQQMITDAVPQIEAVIDETDHAAATNPYLRKQPGQTADPAAPKEGT